MPREIKAPEPAIEVARSFDGFHALQFNDKSHRYKWVCECHTKQSSVGTTTFIKSTYPTSTGLTNWMKAEAMKALFSELTNPGEDGYYPRANFWPVTEKNREELFKKCRDAHEKTAQRAADIGTLCHSFAELHSIGKFDGANALLKKVEGVEAWPLIKSCVDKYLSWSAKKTGKLAFAEALVASPSLLYCGKVDRLDIVDGKYRIRDYKTSKGFYIDQFLQLMAYIVAIKEWLGINVEEIELVRFGKEDGSFETLTSMEVAEKLEIPHADFLDALRSQVVRCRQTYDFLKLEKWGDK